MQAISTLKPVRKVYQEIVNDSNGGPRHVVMTPKNYKQVFNCSTIIYGTMDIVQVLNSYFSILSFPLPVLYICSLLKYYNYIRHMAKISIYS